MTNINIEEFEQITKEISDVVNNPYLDTETKWNRVFSDTLASRVRKAGLLPNDLDNASNQTELKLLLAQCRDKLDYVKNI